MFYANYSIERGEMSMEINIGNTKGVTRKLDNLGRVTLPQEYRKTLEMKERQEVEIFLLESGIYIEKV